MVTQTQRQTTRSTTQRGPFSAPIPNIPIAGPPSNSPSILPSVSSTQVVEEDEDDKNPPPPSQAANTPGLDTNTTGEKDTSVENNKNSNKSQDEDKEPANNNEEHSDVDPDQNHQNSPDAAAPDAPDPGGDDDPDDNDDPEDEELSEPKSFADPKDIPVAPDRRNAGKQLLNPHPRANYPQYPPGLMRSPSVPMEDLQTVLAAFTKVFTDRDNGSDVKGTSVRAPDKFTGKDRTKFRTFMAQLRLVFRANPKKFSSDTNKVTYACSYLDEVAFSWYENYVAKGIESDWFFDFTQFEQELSSQFGTINASAIAERKLQQIKMRSTNQVNDYLTHFTALKNDVDWNDAALSFTFRQGLPSRIKDKITQNNTRPRDLQELIELVLRVDFQHWDRETERNAK